MKYVDGVKHSLETDVTWHRTFSLTKRGARALPRATAEYLEDKFPIIGWLPRYDYRWILNDVIAGLTLGIMLIPQSLAYAKIATMPVQYGLMSSWLPATLYAFMGTSKDLSTGPTSLIGLLTAEVVADLTKEGYTAQQVGSAVAMGMGIYSMILGFLKLGFLLDFVSTPILNGFISAVAIVIGLGQVDSLIGEEDVRDGTAHIIHDVFSMLPEANGYTCGIGFGSIILLVALEQIGKRWGNKSKILFYLSILRAFIALLVFTGISYAVNKPRGPDTDNFLFSVAEVEKTVITAEVTDAKLFAKAFPRAIAPFIAAALEHVAIARAFGNRNNYVTDTSQELCYLGLVNLINSFFHSMGVGGAMSRTAVNSSCKVRSPLSGFVTTAVVLISIYELTGALYWIPKATLSAIVITAIWPLIGTWRTYYNYWRTSLTDFIAAMVAFWVSLFVSTEIGIGAAVGWMLVQTLLRQAFSRVTQIGADTPSELARSIDDSRGVPNSIPSDTRIYKINESLFFPNAQRVKQQILDSLQTHHSAQYSSINGSEAERTWSVVGERRIKKLRRAAGVHDAADLPPIRLVVLDWSRVNHFDVTACLKMREFMNEVRKYAGPDVEIRFAGMANHVRNRFDRARPAWNLIDGATLPNNGDGKTSKVEEVRVFNSVSEAVTAFRYNDVERAMEEKMKTERKEEA
ncbi:uncharacterized protein LTR77_005051 [Saxophila tyrrhenica]|uniref:STAS domain-containing protein n=1 Tax=Saxophila tyrrhenica TaxID=1690608 RepID=A0AAV9PEX5_9PEZI|nr:hypothetical protein LTR77_005051 [Saxophila tyrrhenica]